MTHCQSHCSLPCCPPLLNTVINNYFFVSSTQATFLSWLRLGNIFTCAAGADFLFWASWRDLAKADPFFSYTLFQIYFLGRVKYWIMKPKKAKKDIPCGR